jgi:hypothetical protein
MPLKRISTQRGLCTRAFRFEDEERAIFGVYHDCEQKRHRSRAHYRRILFFAQASRKEAEQAALLLFLCEFHAHALAAGQFDTASSK